MTDAERQARRAASAMHRAATNRNARRRIAQVLAADPELRDRTASPEDFAALRGYHHAGELVAAAFARYADRPCLAVRSTELRDGEPVVLPRFDEVTYGAAWKRIVALATALSADGWARRGAFVGVHGPSGLDWVAADLACLYLGATSVPLQASLGAAELAHVAAETGLRTVLASARGARSLEPLLLRGAIDALVLGDEHSVGVETLAALRRDLLAWHPGLRLGSFEELVARGTTLPPAPLAVPGVDGHEASPLVTLSYTSGSTGMPKGVLYPDARWVQRMHEALAEAPMPYVTVNYMSLAQIGGRLAVLRSIVSGGLTYFSPASDLSSLLEDIRLARPTTLLLIPRASGLVYQAFQRRLLELGARASGPGVLDTIEAKSVMAEMRASFLGDRLCLIAVGAAPTPPEVMALLERCFEVSVIDAYGATELGTIATNGFVRSEVEYKLADVPELGYSVRDLPYPRGELLVKSPYVAPGYWKRGDDARAFADADGFVPSGDIVEERGPRQLVWIDRRNNVLRLAQGEFVSITRIEDTLVAGGPVIAQAYVYGNPLRDCVLAVIVPNEAALHDALVRRGEPESEPGVKRVLRAELARIGRERGLRRHEMPRDFLVERTPFSRDNGLLTESDKPRRPALRETFAPRLEALYAEIERRQLADAASLDDAALPLDERVRRAALGVLGLADDLEVDDASFVDLGGDSVSAVRLASMLARACGRAPSVAVVLDPRLPLRALASRLTAPDAPPFESLHGAAPRLVRASDLRLERLLPGIEDARALPLAGAPRVALVTGASGFLGRVLVDELARRLPADGRVIALVRARDDDAARARLGVLAGRPATATIDAIAGDLALPRFGLDEARYAALAGEVDLVVHAGALVNHALSYRALFEPNVLGTIEVARLATTSRRKPIVFVSSIGVGAGRQGSIDEQQSAAALRPGWTIPLEGDAQPYGLGYAVSKWAGEVLLDQVASAAQLPVASFRCGLLLAHRTWRGQINEQDALSRLLVGLALTHVAPPSFYAAGSGHVEGLPVDLVAGAIATLASAGLDRTAIYHATFDAAASLDRLVDWMSSAGIAIERLGSYDAWYAELRTRLERLDEAARRRSPLLILQRWREPETRGATRFETERFHALVAGERFDLDEAYVHRWLRDLRLLAEHA